MNCNYLQSLNISGLASSAAAHDSERQNLEKAGDTAALEQEEEGRTKEKHAELGNCSYLVIEADKLFEDIRNSTKTMKLTSKLASNYRP